MLLQSCSWNVNTQVMGVSTQRYIPASQCKITKLGQFHSTVFLPICIPSYKVSSSERSTDSTYLVVEEKQSTEQAVQICGEQGEVDRSGAGFLYDHWHEAVETKHAGTKANVQQS